MSSENRPIFSLKVMINKQKSKVLFAEANSDAADVLLSFLTLPMGKIVQILEKHYGTEAPVLGSLTTLYRSLINLDSSYFCVVGAKQMLLNIRSSFESCRRNLGIIDDTKLAQYFTCEDKCCNKSQASNISLYPDIAACDCGKPLNRELATVLITPPDDAGVFIVKAASFIVCDDLRFVPVVSGFLQTLNTLGIAVADVDGAELDNLTFDYDDIMDLFNFSLTSTTPLTDLVMKKTGKSITAVKPKYEIMLNRTKKEEGDSRKLILKVLLQKSTNKFLFAEATDEFLELLLSFLVVPLGGVEHLLEGMACLKNIDNLYRSIMELNDQKYFRTPKTKILLINPLLDHGYISENQFLPLSEEAPSPLINLTGIDSKISSFKSSKGKRNFIKEETMYIVSDDLSVTPFSITSSVLIPNAMGISLSDVKELYLQIGMEEALCILKASLTSRTALTDALIKPMLNKLPKQPKQEQ